VLVQAITAPFAILLDACSFLVSALALRSIRAPEPERRLERGPSLRHDLVAGLRYVRNDPLQRAIAGSAATLNFFGMAIYAVIVLYAVRELHLNAGLIGLFFAAGAVGGLLGTQIAPRLTRRLGPGPTILWATLGFPPALAVYPLATSSEPRWLILGILSAAEVVGGIAVMVFDVNTAALRQAATPEHLYGRTAGAMSFLTQSAKPLGSLFGGGIATAIGLHPTLWVCAAGGLLVIPWTVFSPLRRREDAGRVDPAGVPEQEAGAVPVAGGLDLVLDVGGTVGTAEREVLEPRDEPGVRSAQGAAEIAQRR
jgi:MFS family permease